MALGFLFLFLHLFIDSRLSKNWIELLELELSLGIFLVFSSKANMPCFAALNLD